MFLDYNGTSLILLLLPLTDIWLLVRIGGTIVICWFLILWNLVLLANFVLDITRLRSQSWWASFLLYCIIAAKNIDAGFSTGRCMNFNGSAFSTICSSNVNFLLLLTHLHSLRWLLVLIDVARRYHWRSLLLARVSLLCFLAWGFISVLPVLLQLLKRRLSSAFVLICHLASVVTCPADTPLTSAAFHKRIRQWK